MKRKRRRRRRRRRSGRRAHGRIDGAITDVEQVEDREDAALHGADDALRLLAQLEFREQLLHLGADAGERMGEELDRVVLRNISGLRNNQGLFRN